MTVVYGIVPAETPLDGAPTGIGGAPVSRVVAGGLAALVSPVEGEELRATRRDLLSHSAVLERAIAAGPVLPLRFGIVLRDEDAVAQELLEPRRDELRGAACPSPPRTPGTAFSTACFALSSVPPLAVNSLNFGSTLSWKKPGALRAA